MLTQTIEQCQSSLIKQKMMELWSDQGPAAVVSNMEVIIQMNPSCRRESKCSFLLGTFLGQMEREVSCKQKELLVSTLKGVLRARLTWNRSRAVLDVLLPQNWL